MDESKFPYDYVPEHLKERVKNWRSLSVGERIELTHELSIAAWAKIGVVHDPSKPMDKTIRKIRGAIGWVNRFRCAPTGRNGFMGCITQDFILGYYRPLPPGVSGVRFFPSLKNETWGIRHRLGFTSSDRSS